MTFDDAMATARRGEKVRRPGWAAREYVALAPRPNDFLLLLYGHGLNAPMFAALPESLAATDWEVA